MYNLRTLIIKGPYSNGDLDYLPDGLRYLHWEDYPLEVLPSSFNLVNLLELNLSHSNIKQLWEGRTVRSNIKPVPKLKLLNLSSCENLISFPDLSDIPSAESINLNFCSSLLEILSSRECPKLKQLDLYGCWNLIRIPDLSDIPSAESINLESCLSLLEIHSSTECRELKRLNLSGCVNLIRIPDLSDIPSAESINLNFCCSLLEIHSSRECRELKQLNLSYCKNLIRIPDLSDIPSAESIDLEYCSSLLEIFSSREFPKNLHSLNLLECKNLSRLPSNIHIKGSEFSLFNCISLTNFPHISGNIKRLDLRGSGVEQVPSTIQSLSMLESLVMECCVSLKHISKSICQLKSFDLLDLRGCRELESFPDVLEGMVLKHLNLSGTAIKELPPSIGYLNQLEELVLSDCKNLEKLPSRSKLEILSPLSGLCSLKELRLENCNLTEISEDIGCLSSLERLELEGNVFSRLPKSIKKLSKLYYLSLCNCGMLRSLPELPSSLRYLEAMNCKELIQSLPDESEFELCPDGGGFLYFNFINCLKLNQKAIRNLFRDSLLKMQLMGTQKIISLFEQYEEEAVNGTICLPGSEIPEWFCYKNKGSSINIQELQNDCGRGSYIMGFAVCLVIGFEDFNIDFCEDHLNVPYDIHIETSDGQKEGFSGNQFLWCGKPIEDDGFIDSDHILLGYILSSECYELFQKLDTLLENRSMSDYVGTSFAFKCYGDWYKVKHCGIQPIYVQSQVMNSVAINQDTGDTSGSHPTRICTEAKDFEGFIDDNCNFNSNNNCKETAIEELDLELRLGHSSFYDARRKDCEVKYCGIHPIYVQSHVMNSVAINQDTGDTSGSNDTEETYKPHPKRICTTEAKDSVGSIDDNSNFNSSNNCKETAIEEVDLELRQGHSSFYDAHRKDCEVKHCAIHPIYVQSHVMNSVAINQDTGDISRSNDSEETCEPHPTRISTKAKQCSLLRIMSIIQDTVEETCEPHPTRICTEAKDFEGFIDDNSNFNSSNNNNNCKETAIAH